MAQVKAVTRTSKHSFSLRTKHSPPPKKVARYLELVILEIGVDWHEFQSSPGYSPSFPLKYILCYYKCALKAQVQEFNE